MIKKKQQDIEGCSEACPEVPSSPLALVGLWHPYAAWPGSCSEQEQVVWARFFFPCCLFWCVCFMFKSCGLVWRQPEKNQTVQVVSEGPIRVSAECVMPTDAPAGRCRGLKKKEHLHRPARYICWVASPPASVKCASRGRQTFCSQHVSSPRESITFHKQMLTIKRVH